MRVFRRLAVGAVAVAALTALGGCSSGGAAGSGSATVRPDASPPTSSPTAPTPATAPTGGQPGTGSKTVAIAIAVAGRATPPMRRQAVPLGSTVRLTVSSDTADVLHVSGYDLRRAIPAGASARVTFTASRPGDFEVGLDRRDLPLVQLTVS